MNRLRHLLSACCRAFALITVLLVVTTPQAHAAPRLVGVVTDYSPRPAGTGKPLIWIVRGSDRVPVKDHELLFEGDRLAFDEGAGPDAKVTALVNAHDEISLDRQHDTVPGQSWEFLQTIMPKLVAAYRWVNATGEDRALRRNALSRELEDDIDQLSVFPGAAKTLIIAAGSRAPLWIAWTGGTPPFVVTVERDGKVFDQVNVCATKAVECVRQAQVTVADLDGAKPLTLKVKSASGASWTRLLEPAAIAWSGDLAKADQLGSLGIFLRATDLLDRDPSKYVLESARELATISATYPPAHTMLETLKKGAHP